MSGRGRGTNIPAWMSRQGGGSGSMDRDGGPSGAGGENRRSRGRSPERERSRSGGRSSSRGYYDGRGGGGRYGGDDRYGGRYGGGGDYYYDDPRGGRYDDYRGRGSYRDDRHRSHYDYESRGGRGGRGGGGRAAEEGLPVFRSLEEERDWVDDRRRKRRARKSLFDVEPTPEELHRMEKQRQALELLGGGSGSKQQILAGVADADGGIYGPASAAAGRTGASLLQPQQTRHARRLYIGHLPESVTEQELHDFFRCAIASATSTTLYTTPGEEDPILSVYINKERRFAFVEFKTMEMCTSCLLLDGINVNGKGVVKVKRPNDYNAAAVVGTAPPTGLPNFDVSKLGIISGSVPDGPNKIFIGGLPYHLNEAQVQELLRPFGQIRAFHLVKAEPTALTSKGYCFVEYADPANTQVAVTGLNGMDMGGGKILSARIASARGTVIPGSGKLEAQMAAAAAAIGGEIPAATPILQTSLDPDVTPEIQQQVEALLQAAFAGVTVTNFPKTAAGYGNMLPAASMGGGATPSEIADAAATYLAAALPTSASMLGAVDPATGMASTTDMANAALDAAFAGGSFPAASAAAAGGFVAQPATAAAMMLPQQAVAAMQPQVQVANTTASPVVTRILVLQNIVTPDDLSTDENHADLLDEVKEECAKFGQLISLKIPRYNDGYAPSAVTKVFLEYASPQDAVSADRELSGRKFGPNVVETSYFDEQRYASGALA